MMTTTTIDVDRNKSFRLSHCLSSSLLCERACVRACWMGKYLMCFYQQQCKVLTACCTKNELEHGSLLCKDSTYVVTVCGLLFDFVIGSCLARRAHLDSSRWLSVDHWVHVPVNLPLLCNRPRVSCASFAPSVIQPWVHASDVERQAEFSYPRLNFPVLSRCWFRERVECT